jgi:uncharacterized protein (TIGR00296 family)
MSTPSPSPTASPAHCAHCFDSLSSYFADGPESRPPTDAAAPSWGATTCPFFVTLNKVGGGGATPSSPSSPPSLRGCIGSLSPRPLSDLWAYARKSAFADRRFAPVRADEFPRLEVCVSLLVGFERGLRWDAWEVGKHGIVVEFDDPRGGAGTGASPPVYSATYLPHVASENGWDRRTTVARLIRKAGWDGGGPGAEDGLDADAWESVWGGRIRLSTYRSSVCSMGWEEWGGGGDKGSGT